MIYQYFTIPWNEIKYLDRVNTPRIPQKANIIEIIFAIRVILDFYIILFT
jgi:hypothetical protein